MYVFDLWELPEKKTWALTHTHDFYLVRLDSVKISHSLVSQQNQIVEADQVGCANKKKLLINYFISRNAL